MKTPAEVFLLGEEEVLKEMSWGAESEPRKNLGEEERAARRRAVRSSGVLATGLLGGCVSWILEVKRVVEVIRVIEVKG